MNLIQQLIAEQQSLTAVEEFARAHEAAASYDVHDASTARYQALLPAAAPRPGQQYAFEVDLDACTGCKSCVTGCHNLNTLDEGEVWRTVGLLHGGTRAAPSLQTVTSSCHHCVEPACMIGCPVKAYEKDPITGIVRHLDDQCIGCQYCLFMCPYDAPKFNAARGIVRKCDMCSDRLARAEAPACVQACPNEAIRITVVAQSEVVEAAQASHFLPGAAEPGMTLPTTIYKSERPLPRNLLPADFYQVNPEHSHPPLVAMLVLTQLSVGAFAVAWLLRHAGVGDFGRATTTSHALFALSLGVAALGASVLHLGRPLYAYRAILGLGTSWLSREILAFSLFAGLATLYATALFVPRATAFVPSLEAATAASGLLAVACSTMLYAVTRRASWRAPATAFKFFGSAAILGAATLVATATVSGAAGASTWTTCAILAAAATLKLVFDLSIFGHLRDRRHTAQKRTAILLSGDLAYAAFWRFACAAAGGIALPLFAWSSPPTSRAVAAALGAAVFALTLTGELLERYLFFAAATAPKMPGAPS